MDKKTTGIGAIAVAALAVSVLDALPTTEIVPASMEADDVAVVELAQASTHVEEVACVKTVATVQVARGPEQVWLCNGAYYPSQQAWLSSMAGAEGVAVRLEPQATNDDGIQYNVTVYREQEVETSPIKPADPLPVVEELGEISK